MKRLSFSIPSVNALLVIIAWVGISTARDSDTSAMQVYSAMHDDAAVERAVQLPTTKFYALPEALPPGKPGELIRSERVADKVFDTPPGVSVYRILYHTVSPQGNDVAASGLVLVPYGTAPAGGWPVIVWEHGTTGLAPHCAPSLARDLHYGWENPFLWPQVGYAVVAPDYQGLGVDRPKHPYMDMHSHAWDSIYALPAARRAVSTLSARWVAVGHSQGGAAVIGTAENETQLKDLHYLGGISIAGAFPLKDAVDYAIRLDGYRALPIFLTQGVKASFPTFNPDEVLTAQAMALRDKSIEGCLLNGSKVADFPIKSFIKASWSTNEQINKFYAANAGDRPKYGPLLIIAGSSDEAVPIDAVQTAAVQMCRKGDRISFLSAPDLNHDGVAFATFRDQLAWAKGRFAGVDAPNDCADLLKQDIQRSTVKPRG